MPFAHTKLPGLDSARLIALIDPVLSAHHVEGVELIWRTDRGGMILQVTLERPGSRVPGDGITIDVCSDVSRDLSAALDVDDLIGPRYRLEVGSPGVERGLYSPADYQRFTGRPAKLQLEAPFEVAGPFFGQKVIRGVLFGVEDDSVRLEASGGTFLIPMSAIASARLVFDWDASRGTKPTGGKTSKKGLRRPGEPARSKTRSK